VHSSLRSRDVVGERSERDLDGGDEITVSLENRDDPAPAACIGERAVDQNHGLPRHLLCRRNGRKNDRYEKWFEHVRSSLKGSQRNDLKLARIGIDQFSTP